MKTSSELLLTFLLNAVWQIPLIAAAAALGAWLLKQSSVRYRHWIWVSALLLSLLVPSIATSRLWLNNDSAPVFTGGEVVRTELAPLDVSQGPFTATATTSSQSSTGFVLNTFAAQAIIAVYLAFLLFGVFRLAKAWGATRRITNPARQAEASDVLDAVLAKCQHLIGTKNIQILCSESLPVPVTVGVRKPLIILPAKLVREGNVELLTSAIAHEFVHVARRDYVLNLVYELVYVFVSFHPLAALLRRRIKQTRELLCDELVADRVLEPDVYARSLVTLASAAPPLSRLSVNATVGIADADILEVRVMSLMNKAKLYPRSRKLLLIGVVLLLVVPSVAAMALAMRFNVDPFGSAITQEQEAKQKEKEKEKEKARETERFIDPRLSEEVNRAREVLKQAEEKRAYAWTIDRESLEGQLRMAEELKARNIRNAALMRLARIPMDQAIQIALSQQPGKVLESSLNATHWEEPGKLAADGQVFYHIGILSGDENSPTINHVLVNAVDGTIMKNEKELWPRKSREPFER